MMMDSMCTNDESGASGQAGFKAGDVVVLKSGGPEMTVLARKKSNDGYIVIDLTYWSEKEACFKYHHAAEVLLKKV